MLTIEKLQKARRIMSSPTTFGTTAAGLCMLIFDDEDSIHWDPVILEQELHKQLGQGYVNADVLQRIHAVSVLLSSDKFFTEPTVFHAVSVTLLDPDTTPELTALPPEPLEMAWACTEARILLGDAYSQALFSNDVKRYCGTALYFQGLSFPPAALSFADFPPEVYPDVSKFSDEMILTTWLNDQENQIEKLNKSTISLVQFLRKQLLELEPFGGIASAYRQLASSEVNAPA